MSSQNYQIVTGVVIATIVFLLAGFIIIILIAYSNSRKKKFIEEKQIMQSEFQNELLQTQLEIQEQTLKNISQEIHDNIGQALSLAKLNLNTMPAIDDETLQQKILNSKELVSKAITDLRDLSRSLDTDYVQEMGLQRAIEYEVEMIRKTGTVETSMIVEGSLFRLEKQKELILFRIVQETFNNILKHAGAKNINVNINYSTTGFTLRIKDDGKGVNLQPLTDRENNNFGLGIRNMHNRAKLIGAEFKMNSIIGEGTEVKIILPNEGNNENK
ncbi:MAG TPA: ATP-binding protein [Chitinophagaceae bacterium]|nr:ATP-binding protein [Chitinophagaceae bacterium]